MLIGETYPVAQFEPGGDHADKLLAYPFAKPEGSFVTDGDVVTRLPDSFDDFLDDADSYLRDRGLPGIEDRIPVVEYASDSSPFRNREKMHRFGRRSLQPAMQTIPKVIGILANSAVVWHGKPSQEGSAFAELYMGEDSAGRDAACTIGFLTEEQLAVSHVYEGPSYTAAVIDVFVADERRRTQALAYVAHKSTVLLKDNAPIPMKRPGETAPEGGMSAEQAVDYMVAKAEVFDIATARELIMFMKGRRLADKKSVQKIIGNNLGVLDLNREYAFPRGVSTAIAPDDFSWQLDINGYIASGDMSLTLEDVIADLLPQEDEKVERAAEYTAKESEYLAKGLTPERALKLTHEYFDIEVQLRKRAEQHRTVREQAT